MEKKFPFISIIIPVRNVEKIIGQCLESLKALNYPKDRYEVIVSDSESDDKTPLIVKEYGAILVSTPKRSICAGRNEGFKVARGEIIAFSDADCIFDENWLINSLKYFQDPKVGGVGGINITPEDEIPFGKAVGFVLNQALFSAGSIYGRVLKKVKEVKSIPGCNAIYKREALERVLPLEEEILLGGEDYLMNQRIRQSGYKLLYTPDTIIWHYRRSTPKSFFRQMRHYGATRLAVGKKDLKMINFTHIVIGLGIPLIVGLPVLLFFLNPLWFFYFLSAVLIFFVFYFSLALIKSKSFKVAFCVPYAIIILFLAWSLGFLTELFLPVNKKISQQ